MGIVKGHWRRVISDEDFEDVCDNLGLTWVNEHWRDNPIGNSGDCGDYDDYAAFPRVWY